MELKLNYPQNKFDVELENYIQEGVLLYEKFNKLSISKHQLQEYQRTIKLWTKRVQQFLKNSLHPEGESSFLNDFNKIKLIDILTLSKTLKGEKLDTTERNYNHLLACNQKQINLLKSLKLISKSMSTTETVPEKNQNTDHSKKEIFISHSSKDKEIVGQLINIIEDIGVQSDKIFCSSYEGYGVPLGDNFLITIKEKLDANVLVIFMLSQNFYESPICLCEMGATWIKTNRHIPILIPPFRYDNMKGVIPTTNGMMINEKPKYNSLKDSIEDFFNLHPIKNAIWERKRDNSLKIIEQLLNS